MRDGRLLQLCGADAWRGWSTPPCPLVSRGTRARRRSNRVGLVMDLSVRIGSLTLKNPLIAASGCFGYGVEYADLVDLSTLGGVAVKGLFLAEREGHPPPRIVETPAGGIQPLRL